MKKLIMIIAILILPCFVLAQAHQLSDEDYRKQLISHPWITATNLIIASTGTVTITYAKDGRAKCHIDFKGYHGSGTIDNNFTWSVNNAILHTHTTSCSHSDTHNKKLNKYLDKLISSMLENSDFDEPVDEFINHFHTVKFKRLF